MTSEVRTTIEASDVIAIEIQCKECGTRSSYPLKNWRIAPNGCGNCGAHWGHLDSEFQQLSHLIAMLKVFGSDRPKNPLPFALRFEVSGLGAREKQ